MKTGICKIISDSKAKTPKPLKEILDPGREVNKTTNMFSLTPANMYNSLIQDVKLKILVKFKQELDIYIIIHNYSVNTKRFCCTPLSTQTKFKPKIYILGKSPSYKCYL